MPVTTPSAWYPTIMLYVSRNQAMICASVPASGAGMSWCGPMIGSSSAVYRRVSRSFSPLDSFFGSHTTPPLAPPYGRPTRAFFHVWIMARAMTSSMLTAVSNRMPPLNGPSALLCWQR